MDAPLRDGMTRDGDTGFIGKHGRFRRGYNMKIVTNKQGFVRSKAEVRVPVYDSRESDRLTTGITESIHVLNKSGDVAPSLAGRGIENGIYKRGALSGLGEEHGASFPPPCGLRFAEGIRDALFFQTSLQLKGIHEVRDMFMRNTGKSYG